MHTQTHEQWYMAKLVVQGPGRSKVTRLETRTARVWPSGSSTMHEGLYYMLVPTKEHPCHNRQWPSWLFRSQPGSVLRYPYAYNPLMNEVAMEAKTEAMQGPSGMGSLTNSDPAKARATCQPAHNRDR